MIKLTKEFEQTINIAFTFVVVELILTRKSVVTFKSHKAFNDHFTFRYT